MSDEYSVRDRAARRDKLRGRTNKEIGQRLRDMLLHPEKYPKPNDDIVYIPKKWTNEERLQYYRSHGLKDCADYPGGDAQFEADVLSGEQHDFRVETMELKREDAYIMKRVNENTFDFDPDLIEFMYHPLVQLAFYMHIGQHGWRMWPAYPGGLGAFKDDVLSGKYVRDVYEERRRRTSN